MIPLPRKLPLIALLTVVLSACAPWWQVRPYADFVMAELRPGDQLRVETRDGRRFKMTVRAVHDDRIVGEQHTVALADIARLEKQSRSPPANPCSPQVPLGCSMPDWAAVLHPSQSQYRDYFYPSCERHDYCYRHGYATYGLGREACDQRFLRDMQDQCSPDNVTDLLLRAGKSYATCGAVAMEFYLAVQKYGSQRYSRNTSTYCEYDGPP